MPTPDAQACPPVADNTKGLLPPTSKWTTKELLSFNIRYFDVGQDWQAYLCPPAPLTVEASELDKCTITSRQFYFGILPVPCSIIDLSVNFIPKGEHEEKPTCGYIVRDYGDALADLFADDSTNRAVDGLARVIVKACTPCRKEVQILSQSCVQYTRVRDLPFHSLIPIQLTTYSHSLMLN